MRMRDKQQCTTVRQVSAIILVLRYCMSNYDKKKSFLLGDGETGRLRSDVRAREG